MISLRRTLKVKTLAVILSVAALGVFAASCGGSRAQNSKNANAASAPAAPQAVDVTTAPTIMRDLPRYVEATGSLAGDEQTDVAPTVGGRVVSIAVDLGSYVQRGQVIAQLDAGDAQLRLEQSRAALQQAESSVRQAEARIGLAAGQRFEPTRVAEVQAAKAAYDLAEKNLARFEKLLESGDVSRSAYDQQKAQRDQLREQYQAQLTQANQSYAAVQTARAAAQAARVSVSQAEKGMRDVTVLAPISGYVADRPADLGEYVSTSSKVATIVRTNPLRVRIDIPEQAISTVRPGQSVSVSVSTYPDRAFAGRVARVSPNVSSQSRTLTVEAEVDNGENLLKPGQFATIRVLMSQTDPAVLVPARAVRTDGTTARVFVIQDGFARERLVATGQQEGDLIEIKGNVQAGELVATSNVEQLADGIPVRQ
ncbi:MAG TPA: efflux RND transporter periplasmic adaptor subunit [Pyrinomonadaceae bacterium]|jgi:multidrug efflux pump subunit AcrA (membrane-fusion protein)|nr:efflux RND transporter periplasmic adaptor subunit [Pyrinomonadaceae bacterium]